MSDVPDLPDLTFSDDILPDGARWSTWPSRAPLQRGPAPLPDWVVVSADAIDRELGALKSGKEADVFLVERAVQGDDRRSTVTAAKRYRTAERREFHRSTVYAEGRSTAVNARDRRAMAKKSAYGRQVAAADRANAELTALVALYRRGVPVPSPVQIDGTEILMEFLGTDDGAAAPRLAQTSARGAELSGLWRQVVDVLHHFADAGHAHGDLSPYNLLVHRDRILAIDLPLIVDLAMHPQGFDLLHRDCVTVCAWFARRGVEVDAEELFGELL